VSKRLWLIPLVCVVLLGGGLLWLFLGREPIEEGRCQLVRKEAAPSSPLVWLAFQVLQPQAARPESVRDLPADFDKPCYYEFLSGARRIPLVVNFSEKFRLCLDTEGEGILSRQQCFGAALIPERKDWVSTWRFGPVLLGSEDGVGSFYVECGRQDEPAPLMAHPASFRTGRLKLEGRTYRVAVIDGDYDGRFCSILSLPLDQTWWLPKSDVFAIDLNHNGKFEASHSLSALPEVMPLGRLVRVADTYYAIDITPDGTSLTLSQTQPPLGTLVLEPNDTTAELKLWSDAAAQYLCGRQWQLPAGKYQGTQAAFEKKDAAGDTWSFSCTLNASLDYPLGPLRFFVIEPGQTTRLRIGPPFIVTDQAQQSGREVSLSPVLTGCGGERYQASTQRNGQRIPAPTFKIVDEKGTVLVADKFQYG
jgi:hypothetical protein